VNDSRFIFPDEERKAQFDAAVDAAIERAASQALEDLAQAVERINRSRGQVFRHYFTKLENHA
jgi:hypothetical protein